MIPIPSSSARSAPAKVFFFSPENFLIVARAMFDTDKLRTLKKEIDGRLAESRTTDERSSIARSAGVAPDDVRLNREWYEIWKTARIDVFTRFVPKFTQIIFPPQIRTVRGAGSLVPWHQDAAYMKALGDRGHTAVITCFLPLEESTAGKPLIEFSLSENQGPMAHVIRDDARINKFDLPEDVKPEPDSCMRFHLALGDAFIFGQYVLHRTYSVDDPGQSRTSMEFRLTTKDCLVRGKDYYDLEGASWHVA